MKKLYTLLTILLVSTTIANAGDLISLKINFEAFVYEDAEPDVVARYANKNPNFSVSGITYNFDLYSLSTSELIYSKEVQGEDVIPGDTVEINFGKLETGKLEYNSFYRGVITTEVDFDEDPSNNEGTFEFEYRSKYYNLELKLGELYSENKSLNNFTPAYVHDFAVGQGSELKSAFGEESFKPKNLSFIGWIDLFPNAYYSHSTILFSYDIENDELSTKEATWYPNYIDFKGNVRYTDDVLVYGEEPEIPDGNSDIFIDNGEGQKKKERVCALLLSGTDLKSKRVQDSFIRNVDLMKTALKNKLSNTGLTDENIRVEHGIGADSIVSILESMVGKYDKIHFYYSGHMDKMKIMQTGKKNTESIPSYSVIELLSAIGAKDYCIVWESCFSGLVKEDVSDELNFEDANVTIVTSSAKDKESYANYLIDKKTKELIGYGIFTYNFTKCYQDSSADKNKDKTVTLSEAFDWLKSSKPKDSQGRDIDSLLKFQKTTKSNGTKSGKKISFEETDITITDESGNVIDADNTVTMIIGSNKQQTSNNEIVEISDGRLWNIESNAENGTFKVNLELKLNIQYENLAPKSPNIIGMVWREDETKDWQPQYPSIYNRDENTIICPNLDHFSDWAVGIISANPTSVDSKFLINSVEYGPNPFKNILNIEFNLDEPKVFSIEVVDINGKQMDFIGEKQYNKGTFNVNLDGAKYLTGTYYCRLLSADAIRTIKLVKE